MVLLKPSTEAIGRDFECTDIGIRPPRVLILIDCAQQGLQPFRHLVFTIHGATTLARAIACKERIPRRGEELQLIFTRCSSRTADSAENARAANPCEEHTLIAAVFC
jgi:hypothetical protein